MNRSNKKIENLPDKFSISISYGVIHAGAGINIFIAAIITKAAKTMYALKKISKSS